MTAFSGSEYADSNQYWKRVLNGINEPFRFNLGDIDFSGKTGMGELIHSFHSSTVEKLLFFSGGNAFSDLTVLTAACAFVLSRYMASDVVLDTPLLRADDEGICDTVVLSVPRTTAGTVREYLLLCRNVLSGSYEHQDYPLEILHENQDRLTNVAFRYSPLHDKWPHNSLHDLTLEINEDGILRMQYNQAVLSAELVNHLAIYYERTLVAFTQQDTLLSDAWRHAIHSVPQDTDVTFDRGVTEMFYQSVAATPDAIAIVYGEIQLTYAFLDDTSSRLAAYLQAVHPLRQEDMVAIMMDRNELSVISMLAILKAGACYVPVDPSYSQERVSLILTDVQARLLLIGAEQIAGLGMFDFTGTVIVPELDISSILNTVPHTAETGYTAALPAYVMYTSGSTGMPKGIVVEQRAIARLAANRQCFSWSASDHLLMTSSLSFDASTFEIWATLLNGGKLFIIDNQDLMDEELLSQAVKKYRISIMWFTASWLNALVDVHVDIFGPLRIVMAGGDRLSSRHITILKQRFPHLLVINGYGPTENTTFSTFYNIPMPVPADIPIGIPISSSGIYIMDDLGNNLPVGVPGEICMFGAGVARGYINQPQLTASRFSIDPFRTIGTIYRSGDIGMWMQDGNIRFLGRTDDQVKIRGYRVELSAIRHVLLLKPEIEDAVVVVKNDSSGDKFIVAYYKAHEEIPSGEISGLLNLHLPVYMLPARVIYAREFPLNRNGKIDKRRLSFPATGTRHSVPENETESHLAKIWSEVLEKDIGVTDNFFAMGGDSIKAIRLVSLINRQLGTRMEVKDIFTCQDIRRLAAYLQTEAILIGQDHAVLAADEDSVPLRKDVPADWEEYYPASDLQLGMIFHLLRDTSVAAYLDQVFYQFEDDTFNLAIFRIAVSRLVRQHNILRASFDFVSFDRPFLVIHYADDSRSLVGYTDISHMNEAAQQVFLKDQLLKDRQRGLDLDEYCLWRFHIYRLAGNEFGVLWTFHHAILDGWSNATFKATLSSFYDALKQDITLQPDAVKATFRDYIEDQQKQKSLQTNSAFWKDYLFGFTKTPLPLHKQGGTDQVHERFDFVLPAHLTPLMDKLVGKHGIHPRDLYLFIFLQLLRVNTNMNDLTVGLVVNARPEVEDGDKILGCFLNTVPFRYKLSEHFDTNTEFSGLAKYTARLREFEKYPLADIVKAHGVVSGHQNPLFDILFCYLDFHIAAETKQPAKAPLLENYIQSNTNFDLVVRRTGADIAVSIFYQAACYTGPELRALAADFCLISTRLAEGGIVHLPVHNIIHKNHVDQVFEPEQHQPFRAASTEHERKLLEIWKTLLQKDIIGVNDPFFALGGNSLHIIRLLFLIRKEFNVRIEVKDLYKYTTIAEMSRKLSLSAREEAVALTKIPPQDDYEISPAQRRLWIVDQMSNTGSAYHIPIFLETDVPVSEEKLQNALQQLTRRHEVLRTTFILRNGAPRQVVHEDILRFSTLLKTEKEDVLLFEAEKPFDLEMGPLFRVVLLRKNNEACVLGCIFHHIIADAVSVSVFLKELLALYDGQQLPDLQWQSKDISAWQLLTASENQSYWHDHLSHLPEPLTLSFQQKRPAVKTYNGRVESTVLNKELSEYLKHFSAGSLYATLLATIAVLLHKHSSSRNMIIGFPVTGREHPALEGQIGFYVNLLPLHLQLSSTDTFRTLCTQTLHAVMSAQDHSSSPLDSISAATGARHDPSRSPLFDVLLVLQQDNFTLPDAQALRFRPSPYTYSTAKYDLTFAFREQDGVLQLSLEYNADLFRRDDIQALINDYMLMTMKLLQHPDDLLPLQQAAFCNPCTVPWFQDAGETGTAGIPADPMEATLYRIWSALLGREDFGTNDNFFELGGHSLGAIRMLSRISKELDVKIRLRDIFESSSIRELAQKISEERTSAYIPVQRHGYQESYPVSHAQRRMWMMDQLTEGQVAYNVPGACVIKGPLDIAAFKRTFWEVVDRHEVLRTTFLLSDGEVRQKVHPVSAMFQGITYLENIPEEQLQRLAAAEANIPFDLSNGPLIRASLVKTNTEEHIFLLTMHHIVSDGWSMDVLFNETLQLYTAYRKGEPSPLKPLRIQYRDFATWQHQQLAESVFDVNRTYWLQKLAGILPVIALPLDYPRPAVRTIRGDLVAVDLGERLRRELEILSQKEGATLFMTLIAAVNTLLYRYTGQRDIIVGSPITGRDHVDFEDQIGCYLNNICLRTVIPDTCNFDTLLRQVKQTVLEAYDHKAYPFDLLVEDLRIPRDVSRSPLFDVAVVLHHLQKRSGALPEDHQLAAFETTERNSTIDLRIEFVLTEATLLLNLDYNKDLFCRARMERMAAHFKTLLEAVSRDNKQDIASLCYLTEKETCFLLPELTETDNPATIIHVWEGQVKNHPHAPALQHGEEIYTYEELNEQANRLGNWLRNTHNAGPDTLIGILQDRSEKMIVSILGVLKSGAAWLPLDPANPPARLEYILSDANVPLLITSSEYMFNVPGYKGSICALDIQMALMDLHPENLYQLNHSEDLAYVIYTSGSTGRPKGVAISHAGLVNMSLRQVEQFDIRQEDNVLQFASFSFDAAVSEIFMAFNAGARLVLIPREKILDTAEFSKLLKMERITVATLPPVYLGELNKNAIAGLKTIISAGEAAVVQQLCACSKHSTCYNAYGPTECTVCVSIHKVEERDALKNNMPIGFPLKGSQVYVLDGNLNPVPVGVDGELFVTGIGLARGYLNDALKTFMHFMPNRFIPGERMYRTGDIARWLEDGQLEYRKRSDSQITVRGYRVEPGEIEQILLQFPGVSAAAVVFPGNELTAFVQADDTLNIASLKTYAAKWLVNYMIPDKFIVREKLPVTENGKIDRNSLLQESPLLQKTNLGRPPSGILEQQLFEIWQNVLGTSNFSMQDDFFMVGGHSLKAIQLLSRIQEELQIQLDVKSIFTYSTIESQAAFLTGRERTQRVEIRPADPAPAYDLSHAQRRLWFIHEMDPTRVAYNVPVAFRLTGNLNIPAFDRTMLTLVRRHEILRTYFTAVDGVPKQVIRPVDDSRFALEYKDLRNVENKEKTAADIANDARGYVFDIENDTLLKATLLQLDDQVYVFVLTFHHIISDGWSMMIFIKELTVLYNALAGGQKDPLPPPELQYKDYALWQNQAIADGSSETFWLSKLGNDVELVDLQYDFPRTGIHAFRGGHETMLLDGPLTDGVRQMARSSGVTVSTIMFSLLNVLLNRLTRRPEITVAMTTANRSIREVESVIGYFVNFMLIKTSFTGDESWAEFLKGIHMQLLEGLEHQHYPFDLLVEKINPERNAGFQPLINVAYTFQGQTSVLVPVQGAAIQHDGLNDLTIEEFIFEKTITTSKFDLILFVSDSEEGIRVTFEYDSDLFKPSTIVDYLGYYEKIARAVIPI